jgi:hypothetical protein
MQKSINKIISLYQDNQNNAEVIEKITSFICNRLPIEVVCWQKDFDKNNINLEKKKFISNFLNDELNQFYYIHNTDIFIKYDNLNYSLINEDDVLYLILSEISKNKLLLSKKQQIKDVIIKEIKTNKFGSGIPDSNTIQNIINYLYPVLFKTKSEAKYFLCILGDNILRKQKDMLYFMRSTSEIFLNHINNCFKDYYDYDINNNFYYDITLLNKSISISNINDEKNEYKNTRILNFTKSIHIARFWQHFIEQNILNIISVAIHYSGRYDNSEEYLKDKIENKDKILYLKNNSKSTIIEKFIKNNIFKENGNKITKNELYYIWNLFLVDENIPSIFELKQSFYENFNKITNIGDMDNNYLNLFSHNLLVARKFNEFWNNNMIEKQNEVIEISEIFYFFKKQMHIKTSSEKEIIFIIQFFYPYMKISNRRYINNHSCVLWDKKSTIQDVINKIKEKENIENITNMKLYRKYCSYLKKMKNELVVNKTYFMDVINDIKNV